MVLIRQFFRGTGLFLMLVLNSVVIIGFISGTAMGADSANKSFNYDADDNEDYARAKKCFTDE